MVKYLKRLYDKIFKSAEDIEHKKKVQYYNRNDNKFRISEDVIGASGGSRNSN